MKKVMNLTIKIPSESDEINNINNIKYQKNAIERIENTRSTKHNFTWNDVNVNKNCCIKVINKVKTSCIIM